LNYIRRAVLSAKGEQLRRLRHIVQERRGCWGVPRESGLPRYAGCVLA